MEINKLLQEKNIIFEVNKPLSSMTSWKIGGPAAMVIYPKNNEELSQTLKIVNKYSKFFVMGNGSNILAKDQGYPYAIINLQGLNEIMIEGNMIKAGAGVPLIALAIKTAKASLAGLEFAAGIPGTLGGAVIMNAGAHGSEMEKIVKEVTVFDKEEERFLHLSKQDLKFSYRNSYLKNNSRYIVADVVLELETGCSEELLEKIKKSKEQRWEKQPYEFPNAGSVFKNPTGFSAGKLIEDAGLKGFSINDAEISEKHGNFIVNKGNAKADDIIALMTYIEDVIYEKYHIKLEREVIILG